MVSRVEALQLGDCGQEMALINKLTEGSKVFLSREESQHFIKESVHQNPIESTTAWAGSFLQAGFSFLISFLVNS